MSAPAVWFVELFVVDCEALFVVGYDGANVDGDLRYRTQACS